MAEEQEMNEQNQEDGIRDFSAHRARLLAVLHLKISVFLKILKFNLLLRLVTQK